MYVCKNVKKESLYNNYTIVAFLKEYTVSEYRQTHHTVVYKCAKHSHLDIILLYAINLLFRHTVSLINDDCNNSACQFGLLESFSPPARHNSLGSTKQKTTVF